MRHRSLSALTQAMAWSPAGVNPFRETMQINHRAPVWPNSSFFIDKNLNQNSKFDVIRQNMSTFMNQTLSHPLYVCL